MGLNDPLQVVADDPDLGRNGQQQGFGPVRQRDRRFGAGSGLDNSIIAFADHFRHGGVGIMQDGVRRRDSHFSQRFHGLSLSGSMQVGPASRMQPGMAGRFDAIGQQRIMRLLAPTAGKAAPGRRAHRVAVQPFSDTAGKGLGLGFGARQPAIELGNAGALVEERLPVLGRPAVNRPAAAAP